MAMLALRLGAVATLAAVACVSTRVDPIPDPAFVPLDDEAALWTQAQQIDASLERGGHLLRDAELEAYLDGVASRLLESEGSGPLPVRVRVLLDPYANAFALPDGSVYLHSGLLAPLESEAQLAWVLGHELTHYVGRHALREQRAQQNRDTARQVTVATLAVIFAGASGNSFAAMDVANASNDLAEQVIAMQVAGYSRDLEREADARSLELLRAAGYEPSHALAALELLAADADASDSRIPYVYASHPKIQERIDSVRALLEDAPASADARRTGEEEFQQRVADLLPVNAELELATGARLPAELELERYVRLRPADADGFRLLAEAYRRAGPEREHVRRAAQTLERAASLAPDDARIQRELGLLYRELDDRGRAQASLSRYLVLAPAASDRAIIERYVAELQ